MYFLIFVFTATFSIFNSCSNDRIHNRLIVIKAQITMDQTNNLYELPDDSFFVYKNLAIEKILQDSTVVEKEKYNRSFKLWGYYLIDFNNKRYSKWNYDTQYNKLNFTPFSVLKQFGRDFSSPIYHNEAYRQTDTIVDEKKLSKVEYKTLQEGLNGKELVNYTLYFDRDSNLADVPFLFQSEENRFGGRLVKASMYNNKGSFLLQIKYENINQHPLIEALKQLN
jgi:hypothetical protein